MGGGRKTKHGAEVAPIFHARREESSSRGEDGREEDSDSAASDTSRTAAAAPLTKADLRHLLQEIKTNMAAEFFRHLTPITESLNDLTRRTTAIEDQLDRTSTQAQTNETAISALQDQVRLLEEAQEDLNNRSRRNNIRIRGVPETVGIDMLAPTLRELFCSLLPEASPAELLLDRAHRALKAPLPNATQPRDIIIRMHYFHIKEALMRATRDNPLQIEGHQVCFYQDLAPSTLRKRRELRPLTLELARRHIRYTWGHPFKLQVRQNNRVHTLYHISEATAFAERLGLPAIDLTAEQPDRRPAGRLSPRGPTLHPTRAPPPSSPHPQPAT
ncbi:Hypothetical predicted protein [Pelobates cultripes]|uniref:L1 transposable element RRM domain-containing protein n=1 Tax=Pelobates cultripes TaxID=61616 RepID=A0AAD1WH24_PELCU|nr:Hypothetical predicted protein [Pelobates cultripes]CAH2322268.1 Hypothetical predicted protein [Pelobates cultripes]